MAGRPAVRPRMLFEIAQLGIKGLIFIMFAEIEMIFNAKRSLFTGDGIGREENILSFY